MTQKKFIHSSDITSYRSNHRSRKVFFVIGLLLAAALGVTLVAFQPGTSTASSSSSSEAVAYSQALEMQYAQPWLEKQADVEAAPSVRYSDALALQYARPWLTDAQP